MCMHEKLNREHCVTSLWVIVTKTHKVETKKFYKFVINLKSFFWKLFKLLIFYINLI